MKEFKTIDEQIELLQKRNLAIDSIEEAKAFLLTQNYYNIINGYGNYFPHDGDNYINNPNFKEISKLYTFEREIKQAIFQAIIDAETHLKSIFSYRFAELYQNKPYAYLDINCYDCADQKKRLNIVQNISNLGKLISKKEKFGNNSIAHYIKKHNDVPIWVLAGHLEFGDLKYMLINSTTSLQNSVARDLSSFIKVNINTTEIFPPETMMSFIENINDVRNICAHNNRLLDFKCRRDSKFWNPLHSKYQINKETPRSTVYSVILSLQCFLNQVEYGTLHKKLLKRITNLDNALKTITGNDILCNLGFPNDWHKNTKKITY